MFKIRKVIQKYKYILLALLLNSIGAVNLTLNKYLTLNLDHSVCNLYMGVRYCIAGIIMYYIITPKQIKIKIPFKKDYIPLIILFSVVSIFLFRSFNNYALPLIDSSFASVVEQIQSLFNIILMFVFYKKRPSKKNRLSILLYLIGVIILLLGNGILDSNWKGILFQFISVLCLAFSDLIAKKFYNKFKIPLIYLNSISHVLGGIFLVLSSIAALNLVIIEFKGIHIFIICILIFTTCILKYLWSLCMEHLPAYTINLAKISLITVSSILGQICFHEKINIYTVISCTIIFVSMFLLKEEK